MIENETIPHLEVNEHLWTADEKLKWFGYGEWVEEVDQVKFNYLGYQCLIVRICKQEPFAVEEHFFGGHLCGYIQIPRTHPYFTQVSEEIDMDCHGGLTFNEFHEEHWVGFDCGHTCDYIPSIELFKRRSAELQELRRIMLIPSAFADSPLFNPVYRNMEYCIRQCMYMAIQLQNTEIS